MEREQPAQQPEKLPVPLMGLVFDNQDVAALGTRILTCPASKSQLIVTVNLDHLRLMVTNKRFWHACKSAAVVTIDGTPIAVFFRMLGYSSAKRVTGADLCANLLERFEPRHRPAFIVANGALREALAEFLRAKRLQDDNFLILVAGPDFGANEIENSAFQERLAAWKPTQIFLGVGAPRSEIWVHRYLSNQPAWILCCGAGIEFAIGAVKRAPHVFRMLGMEWLWRLLGQPRRLGRRYLVGSWTGLAVLLRARRRHLHSQKNR